jgi:hypothetical protein
MKLKGIIILLIVIITILLAAVAGMAGFLFGSGALDRLFVKATATPTPTVTAQVPTATPTLDKILKNTYINEKYKYQFNYPDEAKIEEAEKVSFSLSPEEVAAGETFDSVYAKYTGKICITVSYKWGYINITPKENSSFEHVICGRTSRAYEGENKTEKIVIEGVEYTAEGYEEKGPGETLTYHNETFVVKLDNGMRIEYGAAPSASAKYGDYLAMKADLIKIIQSLKKL